ncbi:MAG TPA: hypothetical protein PKN48_10590 [Bacteroidales bacterium]|nr:hypothetical protein [Bacteroidales bacterium]
MIYLCIIFNTAQFEFCSPVKSRRNVYIPAANFFGVNTTVFVSIARVANARVLG